MCPDGTSLLVFSKETFSQAECYQQTMKKLESFDWLLIFLFIGTLIFGVVVALERDQKDTKASFKTLHENRQIYHA